MTVKFAPSRDRDYAENLTKTNMAPYYQKRGIDWSHELFVKSWEEYDNYEVISEGLRVGVVRFTYEENITYLRDFQLSYEFQGKGIGSESLKLALAHAKKCGSSEIRLRVFSENPAVSLYRKHGFVLVSEENALITMSLKTASQ
ncbi:putative Acetyltransferase [Vibrio nigripulchritudo SO65]|uniref:GNAT family N-acetyltransferase n=1 Tax=Vibrio nigripulchritudo TaxID=28173 RepID=UPI0003B193E5|nr:GNAT family N-acetyltransferase [Vibrio nigripulchritudo]CCN34251.1 putative Acetyltransferase [Vibrio nigripulchritudo AM115]CCN44068.1 putative Acetyltransferase [Vibrio nigripulchritudo FTn2]CCN64267.1 putative Acetyltransferase [Vibrio nigripulchritudo POn4]CCN78493.1 putative Acetyltransferase [Vibrio nigripulchritudo SO65]